MAGNGKETFWRCILYWKWGFSSQLCLITGVHNVFSSCKLVVPLLTQESLSTTTETFGILHHAGAEAKSWGIQSCYDEKNTGCAFREIGAEKSSGFLKPDWTIPPKRRDWTTGPMTSMPHSFSCFFFFNILVLRHTWIFQIRKKFCLLVSFSDEKAQILHTEGRSTYFFHTTST